MDADRNSKIEQVIKKLWQIALTILTLAIIPLGVGLRFRTARYILIGAYLLGISLVIMLIATTIWAVEWIKKNVRIE